MSDLCKPELLEPWIDGTCSSEEAHEMEEHVVSCRTCSNEAAWLRRERKLFDDRARGMETESAAMWAKVAPRLAPGRVLPLRSRSASLVGGGLVAAAAALLCVVRFAGPLVHPGHVRAVSASVAPGAALPTHADEADSHDDQRWTFHVGAKPRVVLENPNGDIAVSTGLAGVVAVHAVFDEPRSSCWRVEAKQDKGTVATRVWADGHDCGDAPEVELTAVVPAESELTVHAVDADLNVAKVHGRVLANTVDGDVALASVLEARVKTVNGDISVDGASSVQQKLESVGGDIAWKGRCTKGCALELETVTGDIVLGHTNDSSYRLKFQTVSGEAPMEVSSDDSGLPKPSVVTFNDGQGAISVKTVSGDFSYTDDSPVKVMPARGVDEKDVDRIVRDALDIAKNTLDQAKVDDAIRKAHVELDSVKLDSQMQLQVKATLARTAQQLKAAGFAKEAAELQRTADALRVAAPAKSGQ